MRWSNECGFFAVTGHRRGSAPVESPGQLDDYAVDSGEGVAVRDRTDFRCRPSHRHLLVDPLDDLILKEFDNRN